SAVLGLSGALLLSLLFAAALLPVPGADAAGEESGSLAGAPPIVPPGGDLVVIGTQGLRWPDVQPSLDTGQAPAPALYGLLTDGADAAGVTLPNGRAARCPDSGWLSLSAGRLPEIADERDAQRRWVCDDITVSAAPGDAGEATDQEATTEPAPGDPAVVDQWQRLLDLQRGSGYAAHPGLLGDALAGDAGAGTCATAVGPGAAVALAGRDGGVGRYFDLDAAVADGSGAWDCPVTVVRSEEHTSELQSRENLVCRHLLEKQKGAR